MAPKKSGKGNNSPIVLTLGDGGVTIASPDIPYVEDFAKSLTGGQVKTRLMKMLGRKQLTYDDTVQCAEVLSSNYVEHIKTFPKYDALPNKKSVIIRAKSIAAMAQELLRDDSEEERDEATSRHDETEDDVEEEPESATITEINEGDEEEEVVEEDDEKEDDEKETGSDEELEARALTGFIPVAKPKKGPESGKIKTRTTLLTATYRTPEGREHTPTAVVGVGPGKLKFTNELNDDGSLKRKTTSKWNNVADDGMYFYMGSLNEDNTAEHPLNAGIRLSDSRHHQSLCSNIVVRAFSQKVFTHMSLIEPGKRDSAKKSVIRWLAGEVEEGVGEALNQIYNEAKATIRSEKEESREAKRKLDEKNDILARVSKKSKKSA